MREKLITICRKAFVHSATLSALFSFAATTLVMLGSYLANSVAPFGDSSLAVMDAWIQYLDLFAYYKDVLAGTNSIGYTFSSFLGESAISTFSYFLSSPFSLLVALFDKTDLPLCFDIMVLLKLSLASALMSFYLAQRFQIDFRKMPLCIVLGMAYGLSQYSIAQASNILWLDGVYMLPVLMLGVYRIVYDRSIFTFSVACGLAMIFNWYSGAMAVLFSAVWACAEMLLYLVDLDGASAKKRWGLLWRGVVRYLGALVVGILLSAILLLPTLQGMAGSTRGSLQLGLLRNFSFAQEPLNLIQNYTIGGKSTRYTCSLYCGMFVMLGVLGALFASKASMRHRISLGVVLLVLAMIICWRPLYSLFSLLKQVDSHWVRHSFVVIAALVAIAGQYYLSKDNGFGDKRKTRNLIIAGLIFLAILAAFAYLMPDKVSGNPVATIIIGFAFLLLFIGYAFRRKSGRVALAGMLALSLCDITMNVNALLRTSENVGTFKTYATETQTAIDSIQESDSSVYRIAQNSCRGGWDEAWAYNYKSPSSYTSIASARQIDYLASIGYATNQVMARHATTIIPSDSLNSVKYILSNRQEDGLIERTDLPVSNGKKVFENPYALPIAYTVPAFSTAEAHELANPFEVVNTAYGRIAGMFANIYSEVSYESADEVTSDGKSVEVFTLQNPGENKVLYGDFCPERGTVQIGDWRAACDAWSGLQLFPIPTDETGEASVRFIPEKTETTVSPKFYALDLSRLERLVSMAKSNTASVVRFENGYAEFAVNSAANRNLLVGIPIDDGWEVTVNGTQTKSKAFLDCYYEIPLQPGKNIVVMRYHGPHWLTGGALTLLGIVILIALKFWQRRFRQCS